MPIYVYEHIESGEVVEVFQSMKEDHVYHGADGTEINQWRRVWTVPMASIDTKIDPNNRNEFIRRTDKYKTVGDVLDKSAELSNARAEKEGVDPVRQKFFENYSKERNGAKHPDSLPKKISKHGVTVDLT
jgi:hypothetical protein